MANLAQLVRVHEQKHQCEVFYAEGHIVDAVASLLEIKNTAREAIRGYTFITDWLAGEFWHCELRDIAEFVRQTSRTDAHRR